MDTKTGSGAEVTFLRNCQVNSKKNQYGRANIQGVFFNWCSPKINKYGKKFKYQYWCPPKIYKYGEKLKYQNWCTPNHYQFWGNRHGDLHIWRWEHAAGFRQRLLVQFISTIQTFCNKFCSKKFSLYLELFGGHQLTLRNFRGAPVWKLKIFYLPKNT